MCWRPWLAVVGMAALGPAPSTGIAPPARRQVPSAEVCCGSHDIGGSLCEMCPTSGFSDFSQRELAGGRRWLAGALAALVGVCGGRRARAERSTGTGGNGLSEAARGLSAKDKARVEELFQRAFDAPNVELEEAAWSELLEAYGSVPEVEARVVSNRGNSRARQGKFTEALADYGRSIELAPGEVDAYLNRGASYEALGRLNDAMSDYDRVLGIDPKDPAAWNNRGNALMGLQRFAEARDSFKTALSISGPQQFAFAAVNLNLAEFELGNDEAAFKDLRALLARYADAFPDARAAYALILWDRGDRVAAEADWDRAIAADPRYKSMEWVTKFRRWPPRIRNILQRFSKTTQVKVR